MDAKFLIKEEHKIYSYSNIPSLERKIYWLFKGDKKRDLVIDVRTYTDGRVYKFYIEDEKFSDHHLIENMKKIAEISSIKQIDEEEVIRRILNSKIEGTMNEQYLEETEGGVYLWIRSVEGLDLSDLKDDLV